MSGGFFETRPWAEYVAELAYWVNRLRDDLVRLETRRGLPGFPAMSYMENLTGPLVRAFVLGLEYKKMFSEPGSAPESRQRLGAEWFHLLSQSMLDLESLVITSNQGIYIDEKFLCALGEIVGDLTEGAEPERLTAGKGEPAPTPELSDDAKAVAYLTETLRSGKSIIQAELAKIIGWDPKRLSEDKKRPPTKQKLPMLWQAIRVGAQAYRITGTKGRDGRLEAIAPPDELADED